MSLVQRIEQRIRDIPASNLGYIQVAPSTLDRVLSAGLIRKIAEVAADEAERSLSTAERGG